MWLPRGRRYPLLLLWPQNMCSLWMSGDKEAVMALDCAASGLPAEPPEKIKNLIFVSAESLEAQRWTGQSRGYGEAGLRAGWVARPDICMLVACNMCAARTHKTTPQRGRRRASLSKRLLICSLTSRPLSLSLTGSLARSPADPQTMAKLHIFMFRFLGR